MPKSQEMEFNFTGKKVLVTGAGSGIGRAVAIALVKAECKVYALSRTGSKLDSLVKEYPDMVPITQDLKDWDKTRVVLEQLEPLDGLVNNAGDVPWLLPALDFSKDQLDFYVQNNLYSAINCIQVVAKKMIESGKAGSIVNVSSIAGLLAYPRNLGYNITKAAMDMTSKQFALELGPHNIRVNSVNPQVVMTELIKRLTEETDVSFCDLIVDRTPMGRVSELGEVVSPILYLLSDASAMVTGTCHVVDGGLTSNITIKQ